MHACFENRRRLVLDPRFHPRDASGRRCEGAFLFHDKHAEPTILFFMERFACRRCLPRSGIEIVVHARSDSATLPRSTTRVCEGLSELRGDPVQLHLFNWTGLGWSGYHYDPLVRVSASAIVAIDTRVMDTASSSKRKLGKHTSEPSGDALSAVQIGHERGTSSLLRRLRRPGSTRRTSSDTGAFLEHL